MSVIYNERKTCRACDSRVFASVLDLGEMYLPRFVKEKDERLPKAPLHLIRCGSCGLLQLQHTVHPDLLFKNFWYQSAINESMRAALSDVVTDGLRFHEEGQWLDIGANDGYLLSRVPREFCRFACEPALNFAPELIQNSDVMVNDYFSSVHFGKEKFQVITSAAMFYDIDDPGPFLDDIRECLAPGGVWINQLNDSPTMMRANAFDAICHEHLCYYDIWTLKNLYERHGLRIWTVSHNDVNGGSIRVVAKRAEDCPDPANLAGIPKLTGEDADAFAGRIRKWRDVFGNFLGDNGPVWAYGASTKGTVLLQYLDAGTSIYAIADRNERKHGLLMAGPWTPILSEESFRQVAPRYAVVLPWAFKRFFTDREEDVRRKGTTFVYPLPDISFVL